MSGSADRRHPEVEEYRSEGWSSSSSAAAAAVCYESGCVTPSMPKNATDQFRSPDSHAGEDATSNSTSFWFSRPAFNHDSALFGRGSSDFAERHFYDQPRQPAMPIPAVPAHPLSSVVQTPQPAGACCDFTQLGQHPYDRFSSNSCEYLDLQPFQHAPSYPWLSSAAGDGFVAAHFQQVPLTQCVGCPPPSSAYGPGLDVPYSPPPWVHVKSERRPSLSATSSGVDCSAAGFAPKLVQTSPSYCNDRQRKHETFPPRSLDRSYDEFGVSAADVDKEDWTTAGRCLSDTSPSSVEHCSDAVCQRLRFLLQRNDSCAKKLQNVPFCLPLLKWLHIAPCKFKFNAFYEKRRNILSGRQFPRFLS